MPFVHRHRDRRVRGNVVLHERCQHACWPRLIDGQKQHGAGVRRDRGEAGLDRADLARAVVGIVHDARAGSLRRERRDARRFVAGDDDDLRDRVDGGELRELVRDERRAAPREQRLLPAHAGRLARREQDGGDGRHG